MQLGPTKLIAIRSGSYDYAEIELGTSLQLVGPNNAGKTTLINTLQFLYVDNRNQMVFGEHDAEATRGYYFPDHYSYLLFECLGPHGHYVLGWRGQSKASGGDPLRFCYEGRYEASDLITEDGHVADPREVLARLSTKNYRELREPQAHREAILVATKGDSNGLGLVSLTENDLYPQFKEVLKNLLSLRSIDQAEMKRSLLMLAGIKPNKPALEANRLMTEEFERIRDRRLKLSTLRAEQDRLQKYISMSVGRVALEARLAFVYNELQEKKRKAHGHNKLVKDAIAGKQALLEKERQVIVDAIRDLDERINELAGTKGRLDGDLARIAELGKAFGDEFAEPLERQALFNSKARLASLDRQLGNAQQADRQRTANGLAEVTAKVASTEKAIAGFDRALITSLRASMQEDDLRGLSKLFNLDLLKLPVEKGGVEVKKKKQLEELLKHLAANIDGDKYSDAILNLPLPDNASAWKQLVDVKALNKALVDHKAEQERLQELMAAIENREQLAAERDTVQRDCDQRVEKLSLWERFQKEKGEEARLQQRLSDISTDKTNAEASRDASRSKKEELSLKLFEQKSALDKEDERFNRLLNLMEQCPLPPVADAKQDEPISVPHDPEDAISQYQKLVLEYRDMVHEMDQLRSKIEAVLKSDIIGATESDTVQLMKEQLEGLPTFEEALRKDWENYLHLLRANFADVIRGVNDIRSAAEKLNRRFSKVSVSNLQALRIEVIDQSDLVEPLKELAETDHTGLFESSTKIDAAYQSFRRKLSERITLNYSDLFTLRFMVTTNSGRTHNYDNLQVESHGTAITIKVLFNLLVLRSLLKEDPKKHTPLSRVPFFLDEIHSLDAMNRSAVLRMSRDLGFMALTAAPEPVSEVDALYFLRPQNGRLVVRKERRVGVKYDAPTETEA
ncbi:MAG: hypothetical protein IPN38_10195 [Flavobacteriales bacterium]|nr:hypothetical protein [Flavobacteriales bacterium]MBL0036950.1 hypothetical protein [Flavobacteriales bacterium]